MVIIKITVSTTTSTLLYNFHQVLGKSNSWGARDVARLGLLLTEVEGPDLSAINPEAMAGITPQVTPRSIMFELFCYLGQHQYRGSSRILMGPLSVFSGSSSLVKMHVIIAPHLGAFHYPIYPSNILL